MVTRIFLSMGYKKDVFAVFAYEFVTVKSPGGWTTMG